MCIHRYYAIHREVYKWFNISFDEFGRTSSPQQTEICQAIFKKLLENNWLSENSMQQVQSHEQWLISLFCLDVLLSSSVPCVCFSSILLFGGSLIDVLSCYHDTAVL